MSDNHPLKVNSWPTNPALASSSSSSEPLYTMSQCIYQVSISASQKVILGFMGTSLVINFGILIWWLRLYCYKRTVRKREEQAESDEYPDESDTDDVEKDHRSIEKEVESVYLPYQWPAYQPETERDSTPAKVRNQNLREEERPVIPRPRRDPNKTRQVVKDRDINDRPAADMTSRKGKTPDPRAERKVDRRAMKASRSDVSGSEPEEESLRTEKRRRVRGTDTSPEES